MASRIEAAMRPTGGANSGPFVCGEDDGDALLPCSSGSAAQEAPSTARISGPFSEIVHDMRRRKINVLLLVVPLALASERFGSVVSFVLCLLALVPLANLLSDATEMLAKQTNQTIGGLANATFGNAVEFIIAIVSLTSSSSSLAVGQLALLGSVLTNILLVLGASLIAGGLKFPVTTLSSTMSVSYASLLQVYAITLLIPAIWLSSTSRNATVDPSSLDSGVLSISRRISVFLLGAYVMQLLHQIRSQSSVQAHGNSDSDIERQIEPSVIRRRRQLLIASSLLLAVTTALVSGVCSVLIPSIEGFAQRSGLNERFVSAIILPIGSNIAAFYSAVSAAVKGMPLLSLAISVGSAVQIAAGITPALVLVAWAIDRPLSLFVGMFEACTVMICVLFVTLSIQDGQSTWLRGGLLVVVYFCVVSGFGHL